MNRAKCAIIYNLPESQCAPSCHTRPELTNLFLFENRWLFISIYITLSLKSTFWFTRCLILNSHCLFFSLYPHRYPLVLRPFNLGSKHFVMESWFSFVINFLFVARRQFFWQRVKFIVWYCIGLNKKETGSVPGYSPTACKYRQVIADAHAQTVQCFLCLVGDWLRRSPVIYDDSNSK